MPPAPGQEEPLQRMEKIVNALLAHKDSGPFREPVDWRGLELYDYPDVVKVMVDLGTIKRRLERGQYKTAHDCAEDVRLVWQNCMSYNVDGSDFWLLAKSFARRFEDRYRKVRQEFDVGQTAVKREKRRSTKQEDKQQQQDNDDDGGGGDDNDDDDEDNSEEGSEEEEEEDDSDEEDDSEEEEEEEPASKKQKRRGSAASGGRGTPTNAAGGSSPSGATPHLDARARFGSNLFLLSGKEMGQVLSTIEMECPYVLENLGTSFMGDSKVEINVDAMPVDVFNTLNTYVSSRIHGKGGEITGQPVGGAAPATNVTAAPAPPARRGPGRPRKSG